MALATTAIGKLLRSKTQFRTSRIGQKVMVADVQQ
jgi:hypothetical protein